MAFKWYIIHAYSGFEEKVKAWLEERIQNEKDERIKSAFKEVLVPTEKVVELVKGEKVTSSRKFYPGYVLVCMDLDQDTELRSVLWHLVRKTPKVTGFVGGKNPVPIPEEEVEKIKAQMEEGAKKPKPKFTLEKGDQVKIIDGPFTNFTGRVDEIFPDRGKVKVLISIFGRETPVELDAIQLAKI
ncbi:MAG: transcription termination/antitermination factor NusG [Candidatus Desulfofervidaceae bacterium]|nr:transcription termination/antitermination factor NusG [Candidatus Desulfofervidaceae bacterium]MDL1970891.1 transcription termination/antitermination protein NusG [Candidatus Desulfofervidaceae bacterium]